MFEIQMCKMIHKTNIPPQIDEVVFYTNKKEGK